MIKRMDVIQKDALNAMANIGTRNASRALSESTNNRIRLSVSELENISLEQLSKIFEVSQKLFVAVLTSKGWEGSDNALGCAILVFPSETAFSLAGMLQKKKIDPTGQLSSISINALRMIGQSIIRCYLDATAKFLNVEMQVHESRLVAILGETITDFVHSMLFGMKAIPEHIWMLKTEFSVEPNVEGEYYLLLNENILPLLTTESMEPVHFTQF